MLNSLKRFGGWRINTKVLILRNLSSKGSQEIHMKQKKNDPNVRHKRNAKKLLVLFVNSVLFYALLRLIIELGERLRNPMIYFIGSGAYMIGAGALIIAYFVLNGCTFGKYAPAWDELPEKWSDERKAEHLRRLPRRQEKAKQLLYVLLPLIVAIFISYMELIIFA